MLAWGVCAGLVALLVLVGWQLRKVDQEQFRDLLRLKDAEITALRARVRTLEAARAVRMRLERARDEEDASRAAGDADAAGEFLRDSFD